MKTYSVFYDFSKDGKHWINGTASVKATSDTGAIAQIQSKYPYVKNIKILSVR